MTGFTVILVQARDVRRDERGHVYAFTKGRDLAQFTDAEAFMSFIRKHAAELDRNVVAFSGSAATAETCNNFIETELGKVEVK